MTNTKCIEWQMHYTAALTEFDPDRLRELIAVAEAAMFSRLQVISEATDGYDERLAIRDAASALLAIKRDVLKFPGPYLDQLVES